MPFISNVNFIFSLYTWCNIIVFIDKYKPILININIIICYKLITIIRHNIYNINVFIDTYF